MKLREIISNVFIDSRKQFIIVWQAKTKTWLSLAEKITALVNNLDTEKQAQVLQYVRSLPN